MMRPAMFAGRRSAFPNRAGRCCCVTELGARAGGTCSAMIPRCGAFQAGSGFALAANGSGMVRQAHGSADRLGTPPCHVTCPAAIRSTTTRKNLSPAHLPTRAAGPYRPCRRMRRRHGNARPASSTSGRTTSRIMPRAAENAAAATSSSRLGCLPCMLHSAPELVCRVRTTRRLRLRLELPTSECAGWADR